MEEAKKLEELKELVKDGHDYIDLLIARAYQQGFDVGAETKATEAEKKAAIGSLKPGAVVRFADHDWHILDKDFKDISGNDGVLVLMKDTLCRKAFDEGDKNNWKISSLREHLAEDYAEELKKKLGWEKLLQFKRDLRSEDGLTTYGVCVDTVSLLSTDEYRNYRRFIVDKDDFWWTLTAYSTVGSDRSNYARYVEINGIIGTGHADTVGGGVAPVIVVTPDLAVEIVNEKESK